MAELARPVSAAIAIRGCARQKSRQSDNNSHSPKSPKKAPKKAAKSGPLTRCFGGSALDDDSSSVGSPPPSASTAPAASSPADAEFPVASTSKKSHAPDPPRSAQNSGSSSADRKEGTTPISMTITPWDLLFEATIVNKPGDACAPVSAPATSRPECHPQSQTRIASRAAVASREGRDVNTTTPIDQHYDRRDPQEDKKLPPKRPPARIESPSGAYLPSRKLGSGSFSRVYMAHHIVYGNVALKCSLLKDNERHQSSAEVQALHRLKGHPHIIGLYESFDTNEFRCLSLELCAQPLLDRLNNHNLPRLYEDSIRHIAGQVISAVAYAHRAGVCHRDIKLENILLVHGVTHPDDPELLEVRLADWGFARLAGDGKLLTDHVGSSSYQSPELLKQNKVFSGTAADCWAIGVTLYAMLTRQMPFGNPLEPDRAIHGRFYALSQCKFSPEVSNLVQSFLTVDAFRRISAQDACTHPWFTNLRRAASAPS